MLFPWLSWSTLSDISNINPCFCLQDMIGVPEWCCIQLWHDTLLWDNLRHYFFWLPLSNLPSLKLLFTHSQQDFQERICHFHCLSNIPYIICKKWCGLHHIIFFCYNSDGWRVPTLNSFLFHHFNKWVISQIATQ